uniref:Alpha-L-fucosidase n=1 Tax=Brugia timori TaxID=42155 RepID=A0A0R3RC44_9BILA
LICISYTHQFFPFFRAILEKFSSLPSCSNSVTELITARKSVFHADCYAHTAFNNWTYRFDMTEWTRNFDIIEVWVQNFGAFLERDQGCLIFDNAIALPALCNQAANINSENKISFSAVCFLSFCL